jgi:hypothetical protein
LSSTTPSSKTSSSTAGQSSTTGSNTRASDGLGISLEQILEDARRMKAEDGSDLGDVAGGNNNNIIMSNEGGNDIKEAIRNVLSTIVTADFFVVCGFLLWFLAGIVWRAVFNDDSVQIAFNSE